jgi:DNA-binding beta-propeller fold protein YncE
VSWFSMRRLSTTTKPLTHVICQSSFSTSTSSAAASGCRDPASVQYDGINQTLYVNAWVGPSNRGLSSLLDPTSLSSGAVLLQRFWATLAPPAEADGKSQTRLNYPSLSALANNGSLLYVGDYSNNRVMVFDVETATTHEPAIDSWWAV